jgi:carbonic anhydrase
MAAHWSYDGAQGPEYWGDLDPAYTACKIGRHQSPVNIAKVTANPRLGSLGVRYRKCDARVVNNGHTIQVNFEKGGTLSYGGQSYELLQFHFHSPSEHTVKGRAFEMEAHLVHRDATKCLAVIGVLMTKGAEHPLIADLWGAVPLNEGTSDAAVSVDAAALLPGERSFYAYKGSLTTPPCTEGVKWIVMKSPISVSGGQIEKFLSVIGHNARPVQPLNDRMIEEC